LRFLVDENLPPEIRDLLTAAGHDVVYVPHSEYRSWSDERLWQLAAEEQRVVVTLDRRFRQPIRPSPAGLILIRGRDRANRSDYRRLFDRFLGAIDLESLVGKIVVIRPGYVRVRPLQDA